MLRPKVIINTRPLNQAAELSNGLRAIGFQVADLPLLDIVSTKTEIVDALETLRSKSKVYLVFTSVNGVEVFLKEAFSTSWFKEKASDFSIAAIGEATAEAIRKAGLSVEFISERSNSIDFSRSLVAHLGTKESTIFLLRAKLAGNDFPENLKAAGHEVYDFRIYSSVRKNLSEDDRLRMREIFSAEEPPLVILTSGEGARAFKDLLLKKFDKTPAMYKVIVVGPETEKVAAACGFCVVKVAESASTASLVKASQKFYL